ncbi:MAG: glycosyltransferase [Rhodothermaceae bacterium]|nr:glycosyltransferase [Rhodothermaceae bacterium]
MPHVLHVIEYLDKWGATRAVLSTAKQSAKLGPYEHSIVSLKPAHPEALELAKEAKIVVHDAPSMLQLDGLIDDADILQVDYWNAPAVNHFLHASLPPNRLAIWFHIAGTSSPQRIHEHLYNFADIPIACAPTPFKEHPLFKRAIEKNHMPEPGLVTAPADFDRLRTLTPVEHDGFNVGYIGALSFTKMHQDFISMSANIEIPESKFILCGEGNIEELQKQAASLDASERFEFKGFVEDIQSVLEIMDVYGYPLCEDTYAAAALNLQEVMYAGIPPIVFPHGGIKGLVQHNRTGLFVTNREDYKRAIEYLYYNPVERKRLGINAAAYARAHFGAKNAARAINKVYKRLLELPKRYHSWSEDPQDFAPKLSHKPSSQKQTSDIFIESLGFEDNYFVLSKHETDTLIQLEADQQISKSSLLVFSNGISEYLKHAPEDPYLNLWSGLYQEENGNHAEALSAYATAISSDLTDWRVQWYLGRTLKKLGKLNEAQRVYAALRQNVPNFEALTQDTSFVSSESEVLTFTTQITPVLDTTQAVPEEDHSIRVSAIVSTYNAAFFMEGCMQSLVDQTLFKDGELEVIVIDACSEEDEKSIVQKYTQEFDNITYIRAEKRETLYASWNRGIKAARGKYITSANTDDRHRKDALEKLANYLDDYPEIALIYPGQIDTSTPNETFANTNSSKILDWPVYSYEELERHCIIGSQPMWRRSMHEKYGLFRDTFKSAGDYEFWLRIGKQEAFFRYPEVLGLYYRNPKGIEHGSDTSKQEAIQIWKEYGMFERGIPVILNGRILTSPNIVDEKPLAPQKPVEEQVASIKIIPFDTLINQFEEQLIKENYSQALQTAEQAVQHYPDLPYSHILKAIALRQLANYAEALITLEKSIQLEETPEALVELVQLSISTANLEEAYRTQIYIREHYPDWNDKIDQLSIPSAENEIPVSQEPDQTTEPQHVDDIIELINTAVPEDILEVQHNDSEESHPLSMPAGLHDLDYTVKTFDELRTEFEKLIKVRDVQHAEQLALAATRKFPDNSEAWILKATSFRLKGDFEEAKEAIQQSLLLKDTPEALMELLELSITLGDEEEALQIAEAIKTSYPTYESYISELIESRIQQKPRKSITLHPAIHNFLPIKRSNKERIQDQDVCIVSFPGSGGSWLSTVLADILQQTKGYSTEQAKLSIPPSKIITDLHMDDTPNSWLKEHSYSFDLYKTYDIAGISNRRMVYLFRDPIESLITAFHFSKHVPYLKQLSSGSCDSFCLAHIENYNLHVNAATILKSAYPDRILILNTKNVMEQGAHSLEVLHTFLGIPFDQRITRQALRNCDVEQYAMDRSADIPISLSGLDFLQPGNELSRHALDSILSKLMPIYQEACKLEGLYETRHESAKVVHELTFSQPV